MSSALLFSGFVGLLVLQRFWELKRSQQNIKILLESGGEEFFSETLSSNGCSA
jgi:isoprenylcysteine carboxyl methyltransferase (ICMT) family protein YpbQ